MIRCTSGIHVPILAVFAEPRKPDVPTKASGDRLQIHGARASPSGVQAQGDRSHEVPQWLQPSEEGLSGEPPDSHHVVVEQTVVEQKEETHDDMRVSSGEELTDLHVYEESSKRPHTSKPTGKQNFVHIFI